MPNTLTINYTDSTIKELNESQTFKLNTKGKFLIDDLLIDVDFLDTSDADAVSNNILYGKTAYVNNIKVTGNIPTYTGIFI